MQISRSQFSDTLVEDINRFMDRLEKAKQSGGNEYDALAQHLLRKGYSTADRRFYKHLTAFDNPKTIYNEITAWAKGEAAAELDVCLLRLDEPETSLIVNSNEIIGLFNINKPSGGVVLNAFVEGHADLVEAFSKLFDAMYPEEEVPKINRATIVTRDNREYVNSILEPVPLKPSVPDIRKFFPYFDKTPAEVWSGFSKSKSNILLLMGPPGTGKSSFALEMMNARGWDDRVYLTDREDVLTHRGLADFIRRLKQGSVLILEDADRLLMKREDGNVIMSMLLNSTSGIMPVNVKLVVSVNLKNLNQVDEAFLRPGRCYDILKFSSLSNEQAQQARQTIGLPTVDFDPKYKQLTLAEALNYSEIENLNTNGPTAIGF